MLKNYITKSSELILLFLLIISFAYADNICTWADPVGHWNLSGDYLDCTGRNNLTASGSPVAAANGTTFQGAEDVVSSNGTLTEYLSSMTICLNVSISGTGTSLGIFAEHRDTATHDTGWRFYTSADGTVEFRSTGAQDVTVSDKVPIGEFHEICATVTEDDNSAKLYYDGVLNATQGSDMGAIESVDLVEFAIGGTSNYDSGSYGHFIGTINHLTVYDFVFSDQNASERYAKIWYSAPPPPTETNMNRPVVTGAAKTSANNDTTPTITFNTDINANCSIGPSDNNYTDMGNTRLCSGGQGVLAHTCTVITGDSYDWGLSQNIFIACINLNNTVNQTINATSFLATDIRPSMDINVSYYDGTALYSNKTFTEYQNVGLRLNLTGNGENISYVTCYGTANSKTFILRYVDATLTYNKLWNFSTVASTSIYYNCTDSNKALVWNETDYITITSAPPVVAYNSLIIDGSTHAFVNGSKYSVTQGSNLTFVGTITDYNLDNWTSAIYNSTHKLLYNKTGQVASIYFTLDNSTFKNQTYYWNTTAFDNISLETDYIRSFNLSIDENTAPSVTINTINATTTSNTAYPINYSVVDSNGLLNCSLWTNQSGWGVAVSNSSAVSLSHTNILVNSWTVGSFTYAVKCYDGLGLDGISINQTINISSATSSASGYSSSYLNGTNWFNTDALDTSTTAGVLLYFFVFSLIIGMIILSEILQLPALMLMSDLMIFFFSILIYSNISAILGIFVMLFGFIYLMRAIFVLKD